MSQRYIGGLIYNPPGGFSGYFDGSGDYLSAPDNAAWYFTGDFTVECWAYWSSVSSSEANVLAQHRPASAANQAIEFWSNGTTLYLAYSSSNVTTTIAANQWYHLAMSCTSGTASCYVNGVRVGTFSMPTRIDSADPFTIGARTGSGGSGATGFFTGYISNVRVINGTGIYSGASFDPPVGPLQAITNTSLLTCAYSTFRDGSSNNFTITVNGNTAVSVQNPFPLTALPNPALGNQGNGVYTMSQYQALRSQNLWPAIDPYFDYVTLMLHGNGTNGAQNNTFLDSSTNNFTITRNGNTTQGTFTPYGSNWSNYFDGSGDYLTAANNAAFTPGTGDFTIECWINTSATIAYQAIASVYGTPTNYNGWYFSLNSAGTKAQMSLFNGASTQTDYTGTKTINDGAWHHIAFVRTGTTVGLFVDGTREATGTNSFNITATAGLVISENSARNWNGYISNFRIIKGSGPYDATQSTLSVPTSPLTAITNTSLLTCQSNRFIDNSSNNFTITRNGDVSVQRFSPFNPTTPYAAGTIGGSGYFDGTGDSLTVPDSTAFTMGSGDFSVEFWYFPTSSARQLMVAQTNASGNTVAFWIEKNASNQLRFVVTVGGTQYVGTATATMDLNSWSFIQIVRSGTTVFGYQNGTQVCSASVGSGSLLDSTDVVEIGGVSVGLPVTGYISSVRILKGTASSAAVPTAPLTNITNTQLLLNFTNGGIIDNAMMNDLETVGNAQISTSVSRFGGGSLAFDGSGDYLALANVLNTNLGSGPFTIELWAYFNSASGTQFILSNYQNSTIGYGLGLSSGVISFWATGDTPDISSGLTPTTGVWYHIAVSGQSGSIKMFINGTQYGSTFTGTPALDSTATLRIGDGQGAASPQAFNGYIDDLRITKGYARYTANFTPQRSQWQDQ